MLRRRWHRACLFLLALCAAPLKGHAAPANCPGAGDLVQNTTGATATFFLVAQYSAASFPITVKWISPSGTAVSAPLDGSGILPVALKAGRSVTYSCSATGTTSLEPTATVAAVSFNCTTNPTGTLFADLAGLQSNVLVSIQSGTAVAISVSFAGVTGSVKSVNVQPTSEYDGVFSFGPEAKVTYSCPNATDQGLSLFGLSPQFILTGQ